MKNQLLVYTRTPLDGAVYSENLAYSMHLALDTGDGFRALNHNFGVLFALAAENENGTLAARCLDIPYIFRLQSGGFGVLAVCVRPEGGTASPDPDTAGSALVFATRDLCRYDRLPPLKLGGSAIEDIMCEPDGDGYVVRWRDRDGCHEAATRDLLTVDGVHDIDADAPFCGAISTDIEGAHPRNVVSLTDAEADYIYKKLTTPHNTSVDIPDSVVVGSREELDSLRAVAHYSDGTSAIKRLVFFDDVDFSRAGTYKICGAVRRDRYEFPIAWDRADPCIGYWEGHYYFIATNDRNGNSSLSIRRADSIPELVTAQEVEILNTRMYPHMKALLWAPEFHEIGGRLYIFHAATPDDFFGEQSHVMALKKGGNPIVASDWEPSRRIVKKNGDPLYTLGITLDMTVFSDCGRYYAVWSQRRYNPVDYGAWLYIAELSAEEPWRILSEPVAISRPDLGWANNHTFVDEGPYALITDDKIFLTFSSSAIDSTYVVGMLTAEHGADLLDPRSWTKKGYPLLSSASVPGEYGTGHNSYVTDEYGDIWNSYHGRPGINAPRSAGVRRVHFDIDGEPRLDLYEDLDVDPRLACFELCVTVK